MIYSKDSPFLASIDHRFRLNKPGSSKETWHIILNVEGSGISYRPGDSVGVMPKNPMDLVNRLIKFLKLPPHLAIIDPRNGHEYSLTKWLHERVDISTLSEKLFLAAVQSAISHSEMKEACDFSSRKLEEKEALSKANPSRRYEPWFKEIDVPSFFERFLPSGVRFEGLISSFTPIIPRFYSIASSPLVYEKQIELTVAKVDFTTAFGIKKGLCSTYLIDEAVSGVSDVRVFLQPTKHFLLPEPLHIEERPIIMVGPGTGVAPFRAFLQHISSTSYGSKKPRCWLFFGERQREYDYFYKDFFEDLVGQGVLRLDTAFSRDSEKKEYVQHKMWEMKKDLFEWLHWQSGYFYLCGDAKSMAKDVESVLLQIAMSEGEMQSDRAMEWLKDLRLSGRFRKDVY